MKNLDERAVLHPVLGDAASRLLLPVTGDSDWS